MPRFGFKKNIRTGRYRVFEQKITKIKLGGKECGTIVEGAGAHDEDDLWRIRLALKKERTERDPADFKWITLKARFSDEPAARVWLNSKHKEIQAEYDLHTFED